MSTAIEAVGATLLYLPPYSPDFNPIEKAFPKLKALLREAAERSVDALWNRIGVPWLTTYATRNNAYGRFEQNAQSRSEHPIVHRIGEPPGDFTVLSKRAARLLS